MNMRMPGFTADPAVYGSGGLMYRMAGAMDAPAKGAVVEPQQLLCTTVLNRSIGPVNVQVRLCAIPPSARIQIRIGGVLVFSRTFP